MGEPIEQVIKEYFPDELIDNDAFDDWCNPLRANAFPGAADLLSSLECRLESVKERCMSIYCIKRDFWDIFGGGDRLIKSVASIRSKLARDLLNDLRDGNKKIAKQTPEQIINLILRFSDLGRIRVIADFPSDIDCLKKNLFENELFLGTYHCPKKIKDYVFDPKLRDGLKGHRARQFSVRVPIDEKKEFGFEVQLMTRLQHDWDRRNHPLYEWQRENPGWQKIPKAVKLAVDDFACAEALHLVDQQADINWRRLQKYLEKAR